MGWWKRMCQAMDRSLEKDYHLEEGALEKYRNGTMHAEVCEGVRDLVKISEELATMKERLRIQEHLHACLMGFAVNQEMREAYATVAFSNEMTERIASGLKADDVQTDFVSLAGLRKGQID